MDESAKKRKITKYINRYSKYVQENSEKYIVNLVGLIEISPISQNVTHREIKALIVNEAELHLKTQNYILAFELVSAEAGQAAAQALASHIYHLTGVKEIALHFVAVWKKLNKKHLELGINSVDMKNDSIATLTNFMSTEYLVDITDGEILKLYADILFDPPILPAMILLPTTLHLMMQ